MKQVQQDFIDAITFRYDDETRRTMLRIFSQKETLMDSELLEEHLVNQPILGCLILLLLFLSLISLIFAIVFVSCRALGNCGAKRYQPHPTSARRHFVLVALFFLSWLAMAISASFFIQSGAAFWNPKVPQQFSDLDHTIIRRNSSLSDEHKVRKRAATTKPMSIFDLFGDTDYDGDFEQIETTSGSPAAAFVTASLAPEDRPIPISRTNKKHVISTTNVVVQRRRPVSLEPLPPVTTEKSAESDDVPPAVDRLPIRKIDNVKAMSKPPPKKFEIPARPMAELEFAKHFDTSVPVIQAPFVSDTWSRAAFSQTSSLRNRKLPIQPLTAPLAFSDDNDADKSAETEANTEETTEAMTSPSDVTSTVSTSSSTTTTTVPKTTSTTTTIAPTTTSFNDVISSNDDVTEASTDVMVINDDITVAQNIDDDVILNKNHVKTIQNSDVTRERENEEYEHNESTFTPSPTTIPATTEELPEVHDDVMLSASSDVILKGSDVIHAEANDDVKQEEEPVPVFDANEQESREEVTLPGLNDDVMVTAPSTTEQTTITTRTPEQTTTVYPKLQILKKTTAEAPTVAQTEDPDASDATVSEDPEKQEDLVLSVESTSTPETTSDDTMTSSSTMMSSGEEMTSTEEVTSQTEAVTSSEMSITTPELIVVEAESPSTRIPTTVSTTTIEVTSLPSTMTSEASTVMSPVEPMTSPAITSTTEKETTPEATTRIKITEPPTHNTAMATDEEDLPVEFVPITVGDKKDTWKPVSEAPRPATTVGTFPSVPLNPENSQGKIEQLATPLLYPYRLLHTTGVIWLSRISLFILGGVMVVVLLPSLVLVLLGTFYYKSTQHPIDRRKTSDQIGQLIVILSTFLLFTLPLMFIYVQITLTYHHLHNAVCPLIQLKFQQDLGILGQITSLTPESREILLRNTVNRDNCDASQAPIETMWLSCLCFCLAAIPAIVSLFKLSKYYLRMKTEYYWTLNDYGTIYAKRTAVDNAQSIYGNIYGTVPPRRPTSRPPPIPVPEPNYTDSPIYGDGPIYGVYQAYGRF